MKNKKGIQLSEAVGAVTALVAVAVLVIIGIVMFSSLQTGLPAISMITNNESGYINGNNYTLLNASSCGFASPSITTIFNASTLVPAANYTLNTTSGVITNATALTYNLVNITYGYNYRGDACAAAGTTITQFGNYPSLVGLVGTIILLGLVIGVLIAAFAFRRNKA